MLCIIGLFSLSLPPSSPLAILRFFLRVPNRVFKSRDPDPKFRVIPRASSDFALETRIPSLKWGKSRIPKNLLETLLSRVICSFQSFFLIWFPENVVSPGSFQGTGLEAVPEKGKAFKKHEFNNYSDSCEKSRIQRKREPAFLIESDLVC